MIKKSNKYELVQTRLDLVENLIQLRENFRGVDKIKHFEDGSITHIYNDYSALRIYLILTCFDILGQPDKWRDFQSWLSSKKCQEEREKILRLNSKKQNSEFISDVYADYNKIYGVKKSFFRFINEVLTLENKNKLFDSIAASKQLTPEIKTEKGISMDTGEENELSIKQKQSFLFEIRNSFTHKGLSMGDTSTGIFDNEKPVIIPGTNEPRWLFGGIHWKKIGDDLVLFKVKRWPFVLIEILNETLVQLKN